MHFLLLVVENRIALNDSQTEKRGVDPIPTATNSVIPIKAKRMEGERLRGKGLGINVV